MLSTLKYKNKKEEWKDIKDLNQLSYIIDENPLLGYILTFILFGFAGLPPFGGFLSKYYLLESLISINLYDVSMVVILWSVLSCVTYLRIVRIILFGQIPKVKEDVSLLVIINENVLLLCVGIFIFNMSIIITHGYLWLIIERCIEMYIYLW